MWVKARKGWWECDHCGGLVYIHGNVCPFCQHDHSIKEISYMDYIMMAQQKKLIEKYRKVPKEDDE